MKKTLFTALILLSTYGFSQTCSFGVASENSEAGGNISTGGLYEYSSATDFDVPFGQSFTVNQVKFNVLKGAADVNYVKLNFFQEFEGMPGELLHSFDNLIPTEQEFVAHAEIEGMDLYAITVTIPSSFDLGKGKYFMEIQANPGDEYAVAWEIAGEETTSLGRFDISRFESEPWFGGFSYYDQVFEIIGVCSETGEEYPDMGDVCQQGNPTNNHETIYSLGGFSLADDFIVAENTVFHLSNLKIATMQLGNIKYANIKIRRSNNGQPGEVMYTMENKGPKTENFFGYWPLEGFPLEVVAVESEFEMDEILELEAGTYFVEVRATSFPFTDILGWEATTQPGIGGDLFWSADAGETWNQEAGYNFVFEVEGFCQSLLGVGDQNPLSDFNYYPNPVKDELNFQSTSIVQSVEIYSMSGQLVQKSNPTAHKISTLNLPKGVYLVRAKLENGHIETFKLLKN
jgi:hypothetical protein